MVITKINQNIANITIGTPTTPGKLTIYGGEFIMYDTETGTGSLFKIDGKNKVIKLASVQIDQDIFSINDGGLNSIVFNNGTGILSLKGNMEAGNITGVTIQCDDIYDQTYGLPGVFEKQVIIGAGSNTDVQMIPDLGGVLFARVNYTLSTDSPRRLKELPSFNVSNFHSYYNVYKSGGYYYVSLYRTTIQADISNIENYYITLLVNSNEQSSGF